MELPAPQRVTVEVLDTAGRRVRTLLSGRDLAGGAHEFVWTGVDDAGVPQRNGIYWFRVLATGGSSGQKVVLLR